MCRLVGLLALAMQLGRGLTLLKQISWLQGQKTPTGLLPQQVPGSPSVGSLGLSGLTVPPSGAASAKKDPFADLSAF